MNEENFIFGMLMAFIGVFILLLIVGLILYVLGAIGLYKIANREGKGNIAWLAWIPIANMFVIPILVEEDVHEGIRGKFTLIFGIAFAVSILLGSFIPFISLLVSAAAIYGFYFIALRYSGNAVVHVVIAVVTLGASVPIQLFMFGRREMRVA